MGVLAVVLGLAKVHASEIGHYDLTGSGRLGWIGAFVAILCASAYGFGLPDVPRTRAAALNTSLGAVLTGSAGISLVQLFVGDALLPRFVVFGSTVVLPFWYWVCARLANGGRLRAEARDRVVVVARDDEVSALMTELGHRPERPASLLAHLTPASAAAQSDERPLIAAAGGATVVVLDQQAQADDSVVAQAAQLHEQGVRVRTLTGFYEEWLGKVPLAELERASMLFDIGERHRVRYARAKRVADVGFALLGLVPLILLIPVVWVANLLGNRGPLLYRQDRVGKNARVFTIVKLRTMRPTPEGNLVNEWTTEDDPRITPVGRVLRLTHLDELPQVLNILRGDLSVVGPRPEQPRYVDHLAEKLPFYGLRHSVRPGLTGWAQVKYGYAGNETDALEKLQYEFWYLRNQGVLTDLRIIGRTVRSVLGSEGRGR
jgi:lipopolysaccharide/colanic/teichoic acid biosynthesis glycosyltransferase